MKPLLCDGLFLDGYYGRREITVNPDAHLLLGALTK